jgi:hypothetical protein
MCGRWHSLEMQHCLGHEGGVTGQFEDGIGNAAPGAVKIRICLVAGEFPRATRVPERTPQDEPPVLDWSDLDETAEIFPDEGGRSGNFGQTS